MIPDNFLTVTGKRKATLIKQNAISQDVNSKCSHNSITSDLAFQLLKLPKVI